MELPQDGKANFANELYGESLHISKPGLSSGLGNDDEDLDDFYGLVGDESTELSQLEKEGDLRLAQNHTTGYREGIIAGKEAAAQEGYNIGYKESVLAGYKFGIVRGVSSALAFLPSDLREKLIEEQETREKFQDLYCSVSALSTDVAMKMFYGTLMSNQGEEKSGEGGSSSGVTATNDLGSYVNELCSFLEKSPKIEVRGSGVDLELRPM